MVNRHLLQSSAAQRLHALPSLNVSALQHSSLLVVVTVGSLRDFSALVG